MATNYTSNYGLCQWEAEDKVQRTEFNTDNAKIDTALKSLNTALNGKASTSALSSLQATVSGLGSSKADQSALDSLKATVGQHAAALAEKGNCILYTTSYNGSGAETKSLTFSKPPQLVVVGGGNGVLVLVRGADYAHGLVGSFFLNRVTWSGNSVSWSHSGSGGAGGALNASGSTYYVVALLKAD